MEYNLRVLNAAVQKRDVPAQFFLKKFFKPQLPVAANRIDVDQTKLGKRQLAPVVTPISDGMAVSKEGYKTLELIPAYLHPKVIISVEDLAIRNEGESPYAINTITPEERRAIKMASYLYKLDDTIERRKEHLAVMAMRTGKTEIEGNGVKINIDYRRSADNFVTLSSAKWGSSGADVPGNLRTWRRIVKKNSGENADVLVMGTKAIDAFLNDAKVGKLYSTSGFNMAQLIGERQDNNAVYYGYIPEYGHIYTYEEYYYDEATKTMMPYIGDNEVMYACSNADNRLYYGAINNEKAGGVVALEKFVNYTPFQNGKGGELSIESAPLPANTDPDSVLVATVL